MQHTSRQLLIDQRTAVANSLRSQFAEFGVIESLESKRQTIGVGTVLRPLREA